MRWLAMVAACAVSLCAGAGHAAGAGAPKPVTHSVAIEAMRFEPAMLTVNRGDTVVWANKDPFPHTASSKGAFDSPGIPAGKSWKFRARTAGQYDYICTLHPNMKGTLIVH